ncbi:MAG: transposase [Lentisphaerae bacterium]|nr:transposase [Lentisphaerota bacterium]
MTEEQFELLYSLVKQHEPKHRKFGRPRQNDKNILKGILWLLKSGAWWRDMPKEKFPPYQTCHRRFQEWVNAGVFQSVLARIAKKIQNFDLSECVFCKCQKRSGCIEKTKRGKGSRIMVIGDAADLPVSAFVANASLREITLVDETVDEMWAAVFP